MKSAAECLGNTHVPASTAAGFGEKHLPSSHNAVQYARSIGAFPAAFLLAGVLASVFNLANVLILRWEIEESPYLINAMVLTFASCCVLLLQRHSLPRVVQQRVRLWAGFLVSLALTFVWSVLRDVYLPGGISHVQIVLYSATYAIAFLAVISPPSGRRWDWPWSFDILQAAVLAVMFFQTRLSSSHGVSSILFTAVLQAFLGTAALLARRTASSAQERTLTAAIAAYFFCATALGLFCNVGDERQIGWVMKAGDALYPLDSLTALVLAAALHAPVRQQRERSACATTAVPVLTTAAILLLCVPIVRTGSQIGLGLMACAVVLFGIRVSMTLSRSAAEQRALAQSNDELRRLALTDPLTGIANRRAFREALADAAEHAATTGPAFALVLLDLDHLKQINDTGGHKAGDEAIRRFATALQGMASGFDRTGRLGGDEFAAILPATVDPAAWVSRLRATLLAENLHFSAGVAVHSLSARVAPETLIEMADARLYEAKQSRPRSRTGR